MNKPTSKHRVTYGQSCVCCGQSGWQITAWCLYQRLSRAGRGLYFCHFSVVSFSKLNTNEVSSELVTYSSLCDNRQRSLDQDSSLPSVPKCLWADELHLCFSLLTVRGAPGHQFSCTYQCSQMKSFPLLTWPLADTFGSQFPTI